MTRLHLFIHSLVFIFGLTSFLSPALCDVTRKEAYENSFSRPKMVRLMQETLENFTLYGEPITPLAIKSFSSWLSDLIPSVIALDLNATVNSNQYAGEIKTREENEHRFIEVITNKTETDGYEVLGKLGEDKVIIASYTFSSTGTGVWADILVLRLSVKPFRDNPLASSNSPAPQKRYLLQAEQVAQFSVPDRGSYRLQGTTLHIKDRGIGAGNTGAEKKIDLSSLLEA